jgi:hypothetical protein
MYAVAYSSNSNLLKYTTVETIWSAPFYEIIVYYESITVDFLMSEIHTWVPPSYIYKLIPLLVFVGIENTIWREWKSFYNSNFFSK